MLVSIVVVFKLCQKQEGAWHKRKPSGCPFEIINLTFLYKEAYQGYFLM